MDSHSSQYLYKQGVGSIHLRSCRRSEQGYLKDFVGPDNSALVQEIAKLLDNCGYVLLCERCCIFYQETHLFD